MARIFRFQDATRLYRAVKKEELSWFYHSVFLESRLFDTSDWLALNTRNFRYTFFLSFKREVHGTYSSKRRARCFYYGRARAMFTRYGMSRFAFKRCAGNGDINGVMKASW